MTDNVLNISVLVSGGGSNLQALLDGIADGTIARARIGLVLSSKADVYALTRAMLSGVKTSVVSTADFVDEETRTDAILGELKAANTNLIVLAGYMSILPKRLVAEYRGSIINIHPALLPKFGGKGYYGRRVHEAVLTAGERESGATVHYVDEGVDTGDIIIQENVPVFESDTADILAAQVLEVEHRILPQAVAQVVNLILERIEQ